MQIKKYIPIIVAIVILTLSIGISVYYTFAEQTTLTLDESSFSDTKREEIQRYFGYEPLLSRYLSLPYDVSINTNQQGSFVDIGYLYLAFLPLILFGLIARPIIKWLAMILIFGLLVISVKNSFIFVDLTRVDSSQAHEIFSLADTNMLDILLASIYVGLNAVYSIIAPLIDNLSGDQDYITYPIIISGFLIFFYALYQFCVSSKRRELYIVLTSAAYGFFFFAFSSGIIWYGYLLFLLLLLGILYYVASIEDKDDAYHLLFKLSFTVLTSIWIGLGLVSRISNIQVKLPAQHQGKAIISPDIYQFNTGSITSVSELQDKFITPGFSDAMRKINSDLDTKVYKVGTGLTYFIKQNHQRVIYDNQLGLFSQIVKNYKNKYIISDLLKASNIKFLIIDLNTPSIDNTPERTLTRKYLQIMEYVKDNDSVKLICTDNLIKVEGTNSMEYALDGEAARPGNFAIYEIH